MALTYKDLISGNNRGYGPYEELYYKPGASLSDTVRMIAGITKKILKDLKENKKPIEEFVIGKTFARKKKKQEFDPKNFQTWKKAGGVDGRWNTTYKYEGFDGLIVLCAITGESLPSDEKDTDKKNVNEEHEDGPLFNHQDYALAVEQQLIHHFAFENKDARLGNTSLSTGNVEKKGAKAYVIYMAFKIEREE